MSDNSAIEWTDATWGPLLGCSKVSEGCRNCYAIDEAWKKMHHPNDKVRSAYADLVVKRANGSRNWTGRVNVVEDRLLLPLSWRTPRRIFVNSMSDLFHETVADEVIDRIFAVMAMTPWHTYQVLTKRPMRMAEWFAETWQVPHLNEHLQPTARTGTEDRADHVFYAMQDLSLKLPDQKVAHLFDENDRYIPPAWPLPNVWIGTSTEDQKTADERIPWLLQTPATVRWLSMEPLLGPVNLEPWLATYDSVHGEPFGLRGVLRWVVVGGESGSESRPMHPAWARSLRDQCVESGVPFFLKQWGDWLPYEQDAQPPFWNGQDGSAVDSHGFPDQLSWGGPVQGWMSSVDADNGPVVWRRVGKNAAGRLLDGREHNDYPAVGAVS